MQRYFAVKKENYDLILSDDDIFHIKKVMRMKEDSLIEVVFNDELFLCKIIDLKNFKINIIEKIEINNHKMIDINIIIPFLKEQKIDLILQKATELGVKEITLLKMKRSMIKYDEQKLNAKINRWFKICKEASEQSRRIDIPKIKYAFEISSLSELTGLKIVCDPLSDTNIKNHLKKASNYDKINVVIGPEGGLSSEEIQKLNDMGFKAVNLGRKILRVETVPIFILSILNYENME